MKQQGRKTPLSTDSLTVEIVNALAEHGINHETYTLHDYIDVDALEEVISSGGANTEVEVTIEGIQLNITQHGVQTFDGRLDANEQWSRQSLHLE